MKCAVCKQDIKEGEAYVKTDDGIVHVGVCENYLNEMKSQLNESDVQTELNDIQLL